MKRFLLLFFISFLPAGLPWAMAQPANDNCGGATVITLSSSTCTSPTYSTSGATQSMAGCTGTADDDVWFRYTTPANAASYAFLYVDPASSGFDPVFQALSGACGSQASQACVDAGSGGQGESTALTGLSASTTYYMRVYSWGSGSGTDGSFTACVFNGAKPANDECANAVVLAQGATCSPTAGTTAWATTSAGIPACVGTADDDVWYRFTTGAGVTYERIVVDPTGGSGADLEFDPVVQVFSGACGGLASIACQNAVGAGGTEDFFVSGLTGSTTYYVRVYHFGSWYANRTDAGSFNICVMGGSPPPNDNCTGALALPTNSSCVVFGGSSTTTFATPSGTGTPCTGYSVDDDVWYSFTAINYTHTITVNPNASMDVQIQILEGTCPGGLLSKQCQNNVGIDGTETMSVTGLTIGNVYFVRINHNGTYYGSDGSFTICNVATAPVVGDEPCGAYSLPTPTSACIYGTYNLTGSSLTAVPGTPGCSWGNRDIWFKVQVPGSGAGAGIIDINGYLTGTGLADQVIAVYYSNVAGVDNCNALTYLGCNDDYAGPCGGITQSQYAVYNAQNYWIYIRCGLFSGSALNDGSFKLCVTSPTNDECGAPTFVCDMNGFRGTTNMSYGWIGPPQPTLLTNWEQQQIAGNYGGPYGTGGTSIENPSWLMFEASAATASLTLTVSDCYCGWGIQFQVLAGGTCNGAVGSWTAKSSWPGSNVYPPGSQTVTATGLTIGATYYCLVDGFAGDLCNYQINGATGIGTTVLVTPASQSVSICSGSTTTITIDPVGSGGSVSWSSNPTGFSASGTSVVVNPVTDPAPDLTFPPLSQTVTYFATVTGNCITPQTVSANVIVNATPPAPTITTNPVAFCAVTSLTATANANYANDYEWFNAAVGGASLNTGQNFTPSVSDNQITTYSFYVAAYNNTGSPACTSATRGTITVPINTWNGKIKWTGNAAAGTPNWTNTLNWAGCTPSCVDDIGIIIPDQTTVPGPNDWPVISSSVSCDTLRLEANGRLDLTTGGALNVCGSFGHYGTLNILAGSPTLTFGGNTKQYYEKRSTGSGDLPNVVISNAAGVKIVDGAAYKDMDIGSSYVLTLTNGELATTNTRLVNVKNSATTAVTGFSTASFIDGRLKRAIGAPPLSYDFPVGTSSGYERMKIDFTAGTTITSATVFFEKPSNALGAGLGALSDAGVSFITTAPGIVDAGGGANGGVWNVIPSAGVANYGMTLYGRNYTNAGAFTHTIVKRDPFCVGNWTLVGTYSGSSIAGGTITVSRTAMSGFSQFGIGRHSSVLPVDLLFFDASCTGKGVEISWITASEQNNDYFTLERSCGNDDRFDMLKVVEGAGNSSETQQYSVIDGRFPGGTCYYRLSQADFDGTIRYYDAVVADCKGVDDFRVISIVPNPTKDHIFILYYSGKQPGDIDIIITDVLGNYVIKNKVLSTEGFNRTEIDLTALSSGVYYVHVSNGITNYVQWIVKQE